MRIRKALVLVATAGIAVAMGVPAGGAASAAAPAKTPSLTAFNVPLAGATSTKIAGVNNQGEIAGTYTDATGNHGYTYVKQGKTVTFIRFDVTGATDMAVTSINDSGTMTGNYWVSDGTEYGFIGTPSGSSVAITTLDYPTKGTGDPVGTIANSINNAGTVVGYYFTTNPAIAPDGSTINATVDHGYVWQGGVFTAWDADNSGSTMGGTDLLGINNLNQIVGTTRDNDGQHSAFIVQFPFTTPATVTILPWDLATKGNPAIPQGFCGIIAPNSINDQGVIAGNSANPCAPYYDAWILSGNPLTYTYIDYKGASNSTPYGGVSPDTFVSGINNNGVISGTWWKGTTTHGFTTR